MVTCFWRFGYASQLMSTWYYGSSIRSGPLVRRTCRALCGTEQPTNFHQCGGSVRDTLAQYDLAGVDVARLAEKRVNDLGFPEWCRRVRILDETQSRVTFSGSKENAWSLQNVDSAPSHCVAFATFIRLFVWGYNPDPKNAHRHTRSGQRRSRPIEC